MTVGLVYVIGAPGARVVKIGRSVDIARRLPMIQTGHPERLEVLWTTPGGPLLEGWLHAEFSAYRRHGEWFDFGDLDPVSTVRSAAERFQLRLPGVSACDGDALAVLDKLRRDRMEGKAAKKATPDAIVAALKAGKTAAEIARHLGVSEGYVRGIRREKGLQDPRYAHLKPPRAES